MRAGDYIVGGLLCWLIADVGAGRTAFAAGYHAAAENFHDGWTVIGSALMVWGIWKAIDNYTDGPKKPKEDRDGTSD